MSDFNTGIIAEFRENGGVVVSHGFGDGLVLVHSVGAKSGVARIHPLAGIADGENWLIAASKGGAPENPAWYYNLLANPDTEVEVPADDGVRTVPVHAAEVQDADYAEVWVRFTARSSGFAKYAERTARRIPVLRLSPR